MGVVFPAWLWRSALALAALLIAVGGALHPAPVTSLSFEQSTAAMLADPRWGPAHALLLIAYLLLTPGLLGLAATLASPAARGAAGFAVAGAVVSAVEMAFHLAAVTEHAALSVGGPTPIVHTHLVLATLAQPLLGFSVAVLAFLTARSGGPLHVLVGVLGVLGALGHGLAAPIVVGARNQDFSMLFKLAAPMALWLLWAAATAGRTVRRVAARTAVAEG